MSNDTRYWYKPYDGSSLFDNTSVRYNDLSDSPSEGAIEVVSISRLGGSDYSGNDGGDSWRQYEAWREQAPGQSKYWWSMYGGGHGSFGVVVLASVYDGDVSEEDEDATTVRELLAALETGEGIADENAEYEQLYEATLAGLMEDNFTAQFLLALVNNGGVPPPALLSAFDVEEQTVDLDEIAEKTRVTAKQITLTEDVAQIYHSLGDLFGIYPYLEGSGTNVNAVLSVEDWIMKFNTALVLMGEMLPFPDDENTIATAMLEKILTESDSWRMFQYGKPFYNAIAVFNEMYREIASDVSGAKRAVQEDKYESMGLEAAIEAVLKRADTKFGALDGEVVAGRGPIDIALSRAASHDALVKLYEKHLRLDTGDINRLYGSQENLIQLRDRHAKERDAAWQDAEAYEKRFGGVAAGLKYTFTATGVTVSGSREKASTVTVTPRIGGHLNVTLENDDVEYEGVVPISDIQDIPDEMAFLAAWRYKNGSLMHDTRMSVVVPLLPSQHEELLVWLDSVQEQGFGGVRGSL